ncbi:MAG: hypothetical protein ACLRZH_17160 [Ruthenibacterium lactatiformans]
MTLRHPHFLAVCENGNNTTAAPALLAQPAVSRAVASWRNITVCACSTVSPPPVSHRGRAAHVEYAVHICGLFDDLEKACAAGTNRACCA